jgi:hypothetical protein
MAPMTQYPTQVFFSFTEITDPTKHGVYNEYHHLDHRPANLALPSVHWGERFVVTPRCAPATQVGAPGWANMHYINHYLFRDTSPEAMQVWTDLGSEASYLGRRPNHHWSRQITGFYKVLQGYAAPRVRVPPEVVPMRPALGIHITVTELTGDPGQLEEMGRWYDTVRVPDLLGCTGVAGLFLAVSRNGFPVNNVETAPADARPQMVTMIYLDADPLAFVDDLARHHAAWDAAGRLRDNSATERLLFSSPCELVRPFEYGWFDQRA